MKAHTARARRPAEIGTPVAAFDVQGKRYQADKGRCPHCRAAVLLIQGPAPGRAWAAEELRIGADGAAHTERHRCAAAPPAGPDAPTGAELGPQPGEAFSNQLLALIAEANREWYEELEAAAVPDARRAPLTEWQQAVNGLVSAAVALGYVTRRYTQDDATGKRHPGHAREAAAWLLKDKPARFAAAWRDYVGRKKAKARAAAGIEPRDDARPPREG